MSEFEKLIEQFRAFPGVGRRQAERFAHHITRQDIATVKALSSSLLKARESAHFCKQCQRLVFDTNSEGFCSICSSPTRDASMLMVLEKDADLNHIERAGVYNGLYFVLGGVLPMRKDAGDNSVRIHKLMKLLEDSKLEIKELILALSLTPEGEFTSDFVAEKLSSLKKDTLNISVLGRGLSVGSELEYSDRETIRQALDSRKSTS